MNRESGHVKGEWQGPAGAAMHMRVVASRAADYGADALKASAGARLHCESRPSPWPGWLWCETPDGRGGWAPRAWLVERDGGRELLRDYSAVELTVAAGEEIEVLLAESGWVWARNARGESGWVPVEILAAVNRES